MKKITLVPVMAFLLCALVAPVSAQHDVHTASDGQWFPITLTGVAEAPGPGDPDGAGTATLTLDADAGMICVDAAYADIALPVTGAHIHEAPLGVGGSIVVPFIGGGGSVSQATTEAFSGCADVEAGLLHAIGANPANYYLNLHNAEFPAGAIRGQLAE